MKMAKATEKDIEAAGELLRILDTIDGRFGGPWPTDGPKSLDEALTTDDGDSVSFDADNRKHLQGLYNSLAKLLRQAPNFHGRVIGGMCYVILYDNNRIVDPSADVLELHPRFAAMEAQRDGLLAALKQVQADISNGNCVMADTAVFVDAAIAAVEQPNEGGAA